MRSATPWSDVLSQLVEATGETLYMVGVSTLIATANGIPHGVWLQLTARGGLRPNAAVHRVLSFVTDLGRSMPFIVLLVALTSVTRLIVGGSIGSTAVIVPLAVGAIPFVGRLVQNILSEVHGRVTVTSVLATNVFERDAERWVLVHHHASHVRGRGPA